MQTYGPTIRYHCPLDCGWHHDAPPAAPGDNPNQYAQAPDETFPDLVARMAGDTARLHAQAVDAVLLEHLATHTIPQFVAKLAEQRQSLAVAEARIANVLALCDEADRRGIVSGGSFQVSVVRAAVNASTEQ